MPRAGECQTDTSLKREAVSDVTWRSSALPSHHGSAPATSDLSGHDQHVTPLLPTLASMATTSHQGAEAQTDRQDSTIYIHKMLWAPICLLCLFYFSPQWCVLHQGE